MSVIEIEYLSKYSIERVIGTGSFGNVLLGSEKTTNRKVALKICPSSSESITKCFYNEIEILALLDSPFFPKLYHSENYKSFFVITLEYCPGDTLLKYLEKQQSLDENSILVILKQLLDALSYLHHNKIAHRDIKLENIIVSDDFKVKICDFGFSTFFNDNHSLNGFCGSVQYCSPEMANRQPYNGPANDIWTLGICILKMCIGIKIFTELTNETPITGYYTIFEGMIKNKKLKSALKAILVNKATKRIGLKGLYSILEFEEPIFKDSPVNFIDPIILEKMKLMKPCYKTTPATIQDRSAPEYYIYRLLVKKTYFNAECAHHSFNKEINSLIGKALNIKREFLCCYQRPYLDVDFYFNMTVKSFLAPFNFEYEILSLKNGNFIVHFIEKLLVMEFQIKRTCNGESMFKIILLCGELRDFSIVLSKAITSAYFQ